jgi:hypothetical protein
MPIPLPKLDDQTYADFVESSLKLIPSLYPDWTNHNPSDPGIALVELFAWLSEMVLYRVNQIPDASRVTFLKLLNAPDWQPPAELQALDAYPQAQVEAALRAATQATIAALRERYRAVTADDYEYLATQVWETSPFAQQYTRKDKDNKDEVVELNRQFVVQRAQCVPLRNLAAEDEADQRQPAPGHISVVAVAHRRDGTTMVKRDDPLADELTESIHQFLTSAAC